MKFPIRYSLFVLFFFLSGCYTLKHHGTLTPSNDAPKIVKQLAEKYNYIGVLTAELPKKLNDKQQIQLKKLIGHQRKPTPYKEYVLNSNASWYVETFTSQKFYSQEASKMMKDYIKGRYEGHKVHVYLLRNYKAVKHMSSYLFLFEYKNKINFAIYEHVRRNYYYHVVKSGLYIQPWVGRSYSRAIDQDIDLYLENLLHKRRRIF